MGRGGIRKVDYPHRRQCVCVCVCAIATCNDDGESKIARAKGRRKIEANGRYNGTFPLLLLLPSSEAGAPFTSTAGTKKNPRRCQQRQKIE